MTQQCTQLPQVDQFFSKYQCHQGNNNHPGMLPLHPMATLPNALRCHARVALGFPEWQS